MRILIAEDETPIREWIQFSIERGKRPEYEIVGAAGDGLEAYEIALRERPNLVITDIKMPGIDGIELMRRLRQELPYTDFIVLTSYAEFSYAKESINCGAKYYLLKSELRADDILNVLSEMLEKEKNIVEGKIEDLYSNGYLDIFSCYFHKEDKKILCDFWKKHGFREENPFIILGFRSGDLNIQMKRINNFVEEYKIQAIRPILRNEIVFFLMQAKSGHVLSEQVADFYNLYKKNNRGILTCSDRRSGWEEILPAIDQTEQLFLYEFFHKEGFFRVKEMMQRPLLDRNLIRKTSKMILNGILEETEEVLLREIIEWFDIFREVAFTELEYAHRICIQFCARLEELVMEYSPQSIKEGDNSEIEKFKNIEACREFSKKMIMKLYSISQLSYSSVIREAIHYIHQHYQEQELSLTKVANVIYRAPEYLSRRFKMETGYNFSTYLMMYRMEHAQYLLRHTDQKIYEIAYAVGYGTPSYFSKAYRDFFGETPENVRSQREERM